MLSNPRRGQLIALIIVAAGLGWFAALWIAPDDLFARFGMGMHAITFLAIFVVLASGVAAGVFGRYARVKADLLAQRDVVAAWTVDAASFAAALPATLARDRSEKTHAMGVILFFLALVFGGFALFDPEAAPGMLATGAVVALAIVIAFLVGQRVQHRHAEMRTGEVLIGRRGLQFNGVLHVWAVPMISWLSGVELSGQPPALHVTYDILTRAGLQTVSVAVPVPAAALPEARHAEKELEASVLRRRRSR